MTMSKKKKKAIAEVIVSEETLAEEQLIRQAFKDKDWAEIKGANSWMIFKVMSEFVEGLEKLAKIGPCVTIFGSARVKPSTRRLASSRVRSERETRAAL